MEPHWYIKLFDQEKKDLYHFPFLIFQWLKLHYLWHTYLHPEKPFSRLLLLKRLNNIWFWISLPSWYISDEFKSSHTNYVILYSKCNIDLFMFNAKLLCPFILHYTIPQKFPWFELCSCKCTVAMQWTNDVLNNSRLKSLTSSIA